MEKKENANEHKKSKKEKEKYEKPTLIKCSYNRKILSVGGVSVTATNIE